MQLAGALMVVLPMEHAHVAGWCSCGCAVGGAANQLAGVLDGVACWRSCAGVADGACCQLALLSVVGGAIMQPAGALVLVSVALSCSQLVLLTV